jgi:hypothetical protein
MRQVFTSSRLENVEGVAQLLRDANISIKVTDARSYKQVSRREFSYVPSQQAAKGTAPAVWVIDPEDYKRARDLLASNGLLDEAKTSSYLPDAYQVKEREPAATPGARIGRMRMALLFLVGAAAFWTILRMTVLR